MEYFPSKLEFEIITKIKLPNIFSYSYCKCRPLQKPLFLVPVFGHASVKYFIENLELRSFLK